MTGLERRCAAVRGRPCDWLNEDIHAPASVDDQNADPLSIEPRSVAAESSRHRAGDSRVQDVRGPLMPHALAQE